MLEREGLGPLSKRHFVPRMAQVVRSYIRKRADKIQGTGERRKESLNLQLGTGGGIRRKGKSIGKVLGGSETERKRD